MTSLADKSLLSRELILASVEKGPLVWPSITEDGVTRLKEYVELTPAEAIQADCDIKAINIILQGYQTKSNFSESNIGSKGSLGKIKLLIARNIINQTKNHTNLSFPTRLQPSFPVFPEGDDPIMQLSHDVLLDCCSVHISVSYHQQPAKTRQTHVNKLPSMMETVTVPLYRETTLLMLLELHENTQLVQCVVGSSSSMVDSFNEEEIAFLAAPRHPDVQTSQTKAQNALTEYTIKIILTDTNSLKLTRHDDSSVQSNDVSQSETDITSDSNIIPYSQYLSETQQETVQNSNSSAQQDVLILSMFEQITTQVTHCNTVNKALTTELDRYKEEAVEQHRLESRTFEVKMNQVLGENERLLEQAIDKDIVKTVVNLSVNANGENKFAFPQVDHAPSINNSGPQLIEVIPRKRTSKFRSKDILLVLAEQQPSGKTKNDRNSANTNNDCMSSDNLCVSNSLNDVKSRAKSKKRKSKKDSWKPTGKVFTQIGYIWRPTDWEVTILRVSYVEGLAYLFSVDNSVMSNLEGAFRQTRASFAIRRQTWDLYEVSQAQVGNGSLMFRMCIIAPISGSIAPEHVVTTGSPSSTTVDQDVTTPNISTRLQLHEQALFCYYDAFLTSVEPKNYKEALTQACWIEAMQEELHEFERLEVWELVPPHDKHLRGIEFRRYIRSGCKFRGYSNFLHFLLNMNMYHLPNGCEDCVSESKHIDIRFHFIKEHVENGIGNAELTPDTLKQLAMKFD
ncbi:hypothetical protein Tco_0920677 [Tanacetum coccineum]